MIHDDMIKFTDSFWQLNEVYVIDRCRDNHVRIKVNPSPCILFKIVQINFGYKTRVDNVKIRINQ